MPLAHYFPNLQAVLRDFIGYRAHLISSGYVSFALSWPVRD
jgi:hypothetical protein